MKRDLEFLKDPTKWPLWPRCPVKRPGHGEGGFPQLGVVFDFAPCSADEPELHLIEGLTLYEPPGQERLAESPKLDAEAIVDAGWLVD